MRLKNAVDMWEFFLCKWEIMGIYETTQGYISQGQNVILRRGKPQGFCTVAEYMIWIWFSNK